MFKFNFNVDENNSNENSNTNVEENCSVNQEFGSFYVDDLLKDNEEIDRDKFQSFQSDLVPNIYEGKNLVDFGTEDYNFTVQYKKIFLGGFKTWECSHDLVDYLKTIISNYQNLTTVIEVRQSIKIGFIRYLYRLDVEVVYRG